MEKTTLIKIGKIAIAIALSFIICGVSLRPALADNDHNRGQSERGDEHHKHNKKGHDRGKHRGWTKHYTPQPTRYYGPPPTHYYAPPPNYYYAPEPDRYYYNTQPQYQPSPLSEGINLFFGLH